MLITQRLYPTALVPFDHFFSMLLYLPHTPPCR